MKKQVLIAAVAATMTSVAMADISITGQMKVNWKNTETVAAPSTNAISHEANIYVKGQNGDTKFHMELDSDSGDFETSDTGSTAANTANIEVEDLWMSTKIADVTVKAGTWNGTDSILTADSTRAAGKWAASTNVSGVGILVEGSANARETVKLSGNVAGIDVSYKNEESQDQVTLGGTVSGISVAYHAVNHDTATYDKSSVVVSGSVQGIDLTYAQADADAGAVISGDAFFGDVASYANPLIAGDDISGFGVKTSLGGNTLQAKVIEVDAAAAADDADIIKLVATRPLASGTTLEVTYTDEDSVTASMDKTTLDVELAVKF